MASKYTKWPQNIPNSSEIDQKANMQDTEKFTQIRICGLKI
jgi:hypothetical protein